MSAPGEPHRLDPAPPAPPGGWINRFDAIDPARTALLAIDLQHAFLAQGLPGCTPGARLVVPRVNRLAAALRAAGGSVAFTRHTAVDEGPAALPEWQRRHPAYAVFLDTVRPGTPGHALVPELDVAPADLVVDKYRFSAFLPGSSDLDLRLRARGIDTVIVTGTMTEVCCESSARDAQMMGYRVLFAADATATRTDMQQNATLAAMRAYFADVRDTASLLALIGAGGGAAGRPGTTPPPVSASPAMPPSSRHASSTRT